MKGYRGHLGGHEGFKALWCLFVCLCIRVCPLSVQYKRCFFLSVSFFSAWHSSMAQAGCTSDSQQGLYLVARVACWLLGVALCFAQRACCESLLVFQTTICLGKKNSRYTWQRLIFFFFACPKEKNQNSNAKIEAGSGRSLCKKRLSAEDARTSVRRINWPKKSSCFSKTRVFF